MYQSSTRPQRTRPRRRSGEFGATSTAWAKVKTEIRRLSRDSADGLRRRLSLCSDETAKVKNSDDHPEKTTLQRPDTYFGDRAAGGNGRNEVERRMAQSETLSSEQYNIFTNLESSNRNMTGRMTKSQIPQRNSLHEDQSLRVGRSMQRDDVRSVRSSSLDSALDRIQPRKEDKFFRLQSRTDYESTVTPVASNIIRRHEPVQDVGINNTLPKREAGRMTQKPWQQEKPRQQRSNSYQQEYNVRRPDQDVSDRSGSRSGNSLSYLLQDCYDQETEPAVTDRRRPPYQDENDGIGRHSLTLPVGTKIPSSRLSNSLNIGSSHSRLCRSRTVSKEVDLSKNVDLSLRSNHSNCKTGDTSIEDLLMDVYLDESCTARNDVDDDAISTAAHVYGSGGLVLKGEQYSGPEDHNVEIERALVSAKASSKQGCLNLPAHDEWDREEKDMEKVKERKFKSKFCGSRLMICTICIFYCMSILIAGAMGYWLNIFFAADKEDLAASNGASGCNGSSSFPTDYDAGVNHDMIPSLRPSETSLPSASDGLMTNLPPSTLYSTYLPTESYTNTIPPSSIPSLIPSTSFPPSSAPSQMPSSQPTFISNQCPEKLLKSVTLGDDNLLTMNYEVVIYRGDSMDDLGGLLCVSLEYVGAAGWIGLAFSDASRNPQFGQRVAVIGIPGTVTSVAVESADGSTNLGQQHLTAEGGPTFANPGKYEIPAGGIENGYYGPSLSLLSDAVNQTLINGTIFTTDAHANDSGVISNQSLTKMSFVKYLREPNEVEIDPYDSATLLYAVAKLDDDGEYDGNPVWKHIYLNFMEGRSWSDLKSGLTRKRERTHYAGST